MIGSILFAGAAVLFSWIAASRIFDGTWDIFAIGKENMPKTRAPKAPFLDALRFGWECYRFYRDNPECSTGYFAAVDRYDMPQYTVIFGKGREAWRISQLAIQAKLTK